MKSNIAISLLLILIVTCMVNSALSEALGTAEWSEADFAFYDSNMVISEKPVAGDWSAGYISLEEKEDGQTYRGIRVGSYPEQLLQKYDFTDAEWRIYDTSKDAVHRKTDRSESLSQKWEAEGKTGAEVLAMSDFLCAKGYYFYIKIDVYRFNGQFVTKSQINLDIDEIKEEIRNSEIERALNMPSNKASREELEQRYDDYVAEQGEEYFDYYVQNYYQKYLRAHFQFLIENGMITRIELSDNYYSSLKYAYNDDGTVNEEYAYILDLK